jgi:hypothetical protein
VTAQGKYFEGGLKNQVGRLPRKSTQLSTLTLVSKKNKDTSMSYLAVCNW